ncbi:MAG: GNAT family N-acetyltransferase [Pseudomonadota bacterium]
MIGFAVTTWLTAIALWRLRVPIGIVRGIILGGTLFAIVVGIQNPTARPDLAAWAGGLIVAGIAAVPIGLYALLIRNIRRRTIPQQERAHPQGFVLIEDDRALAVDREAAIAAARRSDLPTTLSVAFRNEAGEVSGSGSVTLEAGLARFSRIWVAPEARGQGIANGLLREMEAVARAQGAERALLETDTRGFEVTDQTDYVEVGRIPHPAGGERIWSTLDLT